MALKMINLKSGKARGLWSKLKDDDVSSFPHVSSLTFSDCDIIKVSVNVRRCETRHQPTSLLQV